MFQKLMLTILFVFSSLNSYGAAKAIFKSNGEALLIIQGNTGDQDASKLFSAMNVQAIENGGSQKKNIIFSVSDNKPLFDLTCTLSNLVTSGSCTLKVYKSNLASIDSTKREIYFAVGPLDAAKLANLFNRPDVDGNIFVSNDRRFFLTEYFTENYQVQNVGFFYRE